MGACSSQQMKQNMKAKIQETKKKQLSAAATPNRQTTTQNGIRTPSRNNTQTPHQSQLDITASSLKNINLFLVYKKTNFSSYYSLLQKETKEFPFTTIQHNHTETIRIIKTYKHTDYKYVDQLLKYQLHHPNIVQQFEIYEEQMKYHVVEENNEKIKLLNTKIFQHELDIAQIFSQIVEVIEYLHHQQLTHGHLTLDIFALFGKKYLKLHELYTLFMKKKPTLEEFHYVPPEYFENSSYTEERDIWSLGIILYQLLYRRSPYESEAQSLLRLEIEESKLSFENTISEEAISLLKQLLEKNISKRIKIWDIKKHIWFKKQQVILTDDQIRETLLRLKQSKKINLLQAYLLKYMINNYPPEKLREIYQVFRSLDLDDDGYFSLSELINQYSEFVEQNDNVKKISLSIFSKVDMDRDGKITFAEFILYAMDRNALVDEEVLQTSFKLLQNKKGVITTECLAQIYQLENKYFSDIFNEFLKKEYINFKIFTELMTKII